MAARHTEAPLFGALYHLPRRQWAPEVVAGITLLAIAVPEQLATAQLAEVPSFLAILAFIGASITFAALGSNPIVSVGADSTIAPLFAVALIRFATPNPSSYLVVVAATAIVTGVLLAAIGLLRLGWIADFLSVPIVAGFMLGIGLTIMVHQLPDALGLPKASGTFLHRLSDIARTLHLTNGWTTLLAVATFALLAIGERLNRRLPWAVFAVVVGTLVVKYADLARHGVATLGHVAIVAPSLRVDAFDWSDAGVVVTTSLTLVVVILSQTAATSRNSADELGIEVNVNHDFVGVGAANVVSGLLGSIPVDASPARTGVVALAGGRTPLVSLVAGVGALIVIPLSPALSDLPLAVLAGVLFYVAGRLLRLGQLRTILRVDALEFGLALVTALAVILIGVQEGIAVAVGLAILDQTRRSARPKSVVLGKVPDSTSWEVIGQDNATPVDDVTVLLFSAPLYFVNAGLFRAAVHSTLQSYPKTTHLVISAAAITDIDFTGLGALATVVEDLAKDGVEVSMARAGDEVRAALARSPNEHVRGLRHFGTVEDAVDAATGRGGA